MRLFPILTALVLLTGCYWHKKPLPAKAAPFFVPGTYVAYDEGNFCATWDTLTIVVSPLQPNLYAISRRTSFQRYLSDNFFPEQRTQTKWKGLYDPTSTVLRAIGQRSDLAFVPDQNLFILQRVIYRRIE